MTKQILVTGGAGFIGSFLVDELVKGGHQITILDNFVKQVHPFFPEYINKSAELLVGDVSDYDIIKQAIVNKDIIFHLAAAVGIGQSNYEIAQFTKSNVLGTANVLHALVNEKHDVKKVIIPSSNTCYGEGLYKTEDGDVFHPSIRPVEQLEKGIWNPVHPETKKEGSPIPTPEPTELLCNSIYSLTKRQQEDMALFVGKTYGIPITVLRYFNVYGPRQSLSNPYTGVSAIFLSRLKSGNQPVIYEDGKQSRDFVSVHDITSANLIVMNNKASDYETFNVSSGVSTSIKQLSLDVAKLLKTNIQPKIVGSYRKGDIRHCQADISKIKDKLDWEPKWPLSNGLKELVKWSESQKAEDNFDRANAELKSKGLL